MANSIATPAHVIKFFIPYSSTRDITGTLGFHLVKKGLLARPNKCEGD